jgi:NtrC-family two-component system response regulator AlgB
VLLPEILRRQFGVQIIVITAFATFETAVEAMKLGAVDYLPKPFTPDQVRAAAHRVVTANLLKRQLTELKDRLDETQGESCFETEARPTRLSSRLQLGRRLRTPSCCFAARAEPARTCSPAGCAPKVDARRPRLSRSIAFCFPPI